MDTRRRWAIFYTYNEFETTITRWVETKNVTVTKAADAADEFARKQPEYRLCKHYEIRFIAEHELHELQQSYRRFVTVIDSIMGGVES